MGDDDLPRREVARIVGSDVGFGAEESYLEPE